MDYIRTAAGSEASDQSFRASSSKPNWLLTPLPLSQLRPDLESSTTSAVTSLGSSCLAAISRDLHHFSFSSFSTLPPHLLRRILFRARADRNYEDDLSGQTNTHPDEATLWAIQALYLPNETNDHTLGLPSNHLLHNMYQHPLTTLPTLQPGLDVDSPNLINLNFKFLTTLKLDTLNGPIDDQNIQSLKWCTHLTSLCMNGTGVTDYGITLLASALELPAEKGLRRLRAWSVARCKGISDKSMRSFAKFPGLVMLVTSCFEEPCPRKLPADTLVADLRETSCTDVAMDIFNRQSAALFPHPGFQSCTEGLIGLFATPKPATELLANLSATLLRIPDYTALHVVPTTAEISPRFTPFPTQPTASGSRPSSRVAYRADGTGAIYGKDVSRIKDTVGDLRFAVNNLPLAWQIEEDAANGIERKKFRSSWDRDGKARFCRRTWEEEYKPKLKFFKQEKPRARKEPEIKGDPKLMLVRMIDDGWDKLTWGTSVKTTSRPASSAGPTTSQRVKAVPSTALLDDIRSTAKRKTSGPFRPAPQTSSPTSSPAAPTDRKPLVSRPSLNPFRISASPAASPRPLSQASSDPPSASDDDFGFSNSQSKKRRFEGADTADKKRAGMRMFGVKR